MTRDGTKVGERKFVSVEQLIFVLYIKRYSPGCKCEGVYTHGMQHNGVGWVRRERGELGIYGSTCTMPMRS